MPVVATILSVTRGNSAAHSTVLEPTFNLSAIISDLPVHEYVLKLDQLQKCLLIIPREIRTLF